MYDIWFYVFFWLVAILFALPIVFVGFVWLFMQRPPISEKLTLQTIQVILNTIKNKEDFEIFLRKFLKNFITLPVDESDRKVWFALIEKMAYSKFIDIDEVAQFGQELENANVESQKEIANTISMVLKTRKKG